MEEDKFAKPDDDDKNKHLSFWYRFNLILKYAIPTVLTCVIK